MSTLIAAASHWKAEAEAAAERAAYDRKRGFTGLSHPGEHNASLYTKVAKALRLQDETGKAHCLCHMIPADECKQIMGRKNF